MWVVDFGHNSAMAKHEEDVEEGRIFVLSVTCWRTKSQAPQDHSNRGGERYPRSRRKNSKFVRYIILFRNNTRFEGRLSVPVGHEVDRLKTYSFGADFRTVIHIP